MSKSTQTSFRDKERQAGRANVWRQERKHLIHTQRMAEGPAMIMKPEPEVPSRVKPHGGRGGGAVLGIRASAIKLTWSRGEKTANYAGSDRGCEHGGKRY